MLVVVDGEALAYTAASLVADTAAAAANRSAHALIALSGGSTPKRMGQLFAESPLRDAVAWANLQVFWGDERYVSIKDSQSNAGEAKRGFLDSVGIPAGQIHPFDTTERDPETSALSMERELVSIAGESLPRFDLVLLGMGDDGHTASLFPGTAAIHETERLVMSHDVAKLDATRLTFTPPLINAARQVAFLVGGAGKADTLHAVLDGPVDADAYPAQIVRPTDGTLVWIVDEAAAAQLERGTPNE